MNVFNLMIVFGGIFTISLIAIFVNYIIGFKKAQKAMENYVSESQMRNDILKMTMLHIVFGGICSLSGIASIVCFILFLVEKMGK